MKEKDLVDRVFDYLKGSLPNWPEKELEQAKAAIREEFGGQPGVFKRSPIEKERIRMLVLGQFNGRNASELARELKISRTTVYRLLRTEGVPKPVELAQRRR